MVDRKKFKSAIQRVEALKGFYIHLTVFVLVMTLLTLVNVQDGDDWWVQWPLFGWGLGLIGHALAVFGRTPAAIAAWEKRKLREIVSRDHVQRS